MNEQLLNEIKSCTAMPTLPGVAMQIIQLTRRPEVDIRDIASLVANDPALSTKVLRTVNSSFYGLSKTVGTISQALVILGLQSVKTLALGFSLAGSLRRSQPRGFDHMAYWRRSIHSAVAAKALAGHLKVVQAEECFLAGLLQDIGMLAMHTALGDRYSQICAKVEDHNDLPAMEDKELQLNHAEVGAMICESWSLPPILSVPIGGHHQPEQAEKSVRNIARLVHFAGLCADVFMLADPVQSIATARKVGQEQFNLDQGAIDQLLAGIGDSVREVADLFEVNIGQHVDYPTILAQANQALLDLTLQSQQLAQQLENRNKKLQEAASTDPLTGLANRSRLAEFAEAEFRRAKKFLRPLSVLFVDADRFKNINDTYGHAAGDEVLKAFARILQSACRSVDLVSRYGGEEFVCVLTETDLLNAAQLAESIRIAVAEEIIQFEGVRIPANISVGVACMEGGQFFTGPEHLMDCADRAVYAAKRDGRNRVRIYNAAAARKAPDPA